MMPVLLASAWASAYLPISDFGQSVSFFKIDERFWILWTIGGLLMASGAGNGEQSSWKSSWIRRGIWALIIALPGLFRLIHTAWVTGSIPSGLLDATRGYGALWRQLTIALVLGLLYPRVFRWVTRARGTAQG